MVELFLIRPPMWEMSVCRFLIAVMACTRFSWHLLDCFILEGSYYYLMLLCSFLWLNCSTLPNLWKAELELRRKKRCVLLSVHCLLREKNEACWVQKLCMGTLNCIQCCKMHWRKKVIQQNAFLFRYGVRART